MKKNYIFDVGPLRMMTHEEIKMAGETWTDEQIAETGLGQKRQSEMRIWAQMCRDYIEENPEPPAVEEEIFPSQRLTWLLSQAVGEHISPYIDVEEMEFSFGDGDLTKNELKLCIIAKGPRKPLVGAELAQAGQPDICYQVKRTQPN